VQIVSNKYSRPAGRTPTTLGPSCKRFDGEGQHRGIKGGAGSGRRKQPEKGEDVLKD